MSRQSQLSDFQVESAGTSPVDLDITGLTCPMTFVRVRLLLDRLSAGSQASVLLRGGEPRANIPRQLVRLGHQVLALQAQPPEGTWRLTFRKAG